MSVEEEPADLERMMRFSLDADAASSGLNVESVKDGCWYRVKDEEAESCCVFVAVLPSAAAVLTPRARAEGEVREPRGGARGSRRIPCGPAP